MLRAMAARGIAVVCRFVCAAVLAACVAAPAMTGGRALAQGYASAADESFTGDELEQLVGPIALYPDVVVAIVLPASTTPQHVAAAAQFVQQRARNPAAQPPAAWSEALRA